MESLIDFPGDFSDEKDEEPKPKKARKKKPPRMYTNEDIQRALSDIRGGETRTSVSKRYGIPKTTLYDHLVERYTGVKRGPQPALGVDVEEALAEWIIDAQRRGFPVSRMQLRETAGRIARKGAKKKFGEAGMPGETWTSRFLKRHPQLSLKKCESIQGGCGGVIADIILDYRESQESVLTEAGVTEQDFRNRRLWFIADETVMRFSTDTILKADTTSQYGAKFVDQQVDNEKEVVVYLCYNVAGEHPGSTVLLKEKQLDCAPLSTLPEGFGFGYSETGRMKPPNVVNYVKTVFVPWLKREGLFGQNIMLTLDGHSSQISYDLSVLCRENNIHLLRLLPNMSYLRQQDIGAFRPLALAWEEYVIRFEEGLCDEDGNAAEKSSKERNITKVTFASHLPPVFARAMSKPACELTFHKYGLFPWSSEAIELIECLEAQNTSTLCFRLESPSFENLSTSEKYGQFPSSMNTTDRIDCLETQNPSDFAPEPSGQTSAPPRRDGLQRHCGYQSSLNATLRAITERIDQDVLRQFEEDEDRPSWEGEAALEALFYLWRDLKRCAEAEETTKLDDSCDVTADKFGNMARTKMEIEDDGNSISPRPQKRNSRRNYIEREDLRTGIFSKKKKIILQELEQLSTNTGVEILLQVQRTSDFADKRITITELETPKFDHRLLNVPAVRKKAYYLDGQRVPLATQWEVTQSEIARLQDFRPAESAEPLTSKKRNNAGAEQPQNGSVANHHQTSVTESVTSYRYEGREHSLYSVNQFMEGEDRACSQDSELYVEDAGVQVKEEVLELFTDGPGGDPLPPEGFDNISPGIFGLNQKETTRQSLLAVKDFLSSHKEQFGLIIFDRFDDNALKIFEAKMNERYPPGRATDHGIARRAENGEHGIGTNRLTGHEEPLHGSFVPSLSVEERPNPLTNAYTDLNENKSKEGPQKRLKSGAGRKTQARPEPSTAVVVKTGETSGRTKIGASNSRPWKT